MQSRWENGIGVCAALFILAVGCSDSSSPGSSGSSAKAVWQPCHDSFECATVEVPVDYDVPDGAKIPLAILRAPATNPEARIGSIVINPGGPGAPMVDRLVAQYGTLRLAFARAAERFDFVAFDWRGSGRSAPLRCVDDAFFDELRGAGLTLEAPGDVERLESLARRLADGCRAATSDAMLASLHTENAARDLERIREALGEEKLSYLGLSYGTWLGATYATLFPERVRAFVLDAPVFLPVDARAQIERRARSHSAALERFFAACGADPGCAFHGGEGAAAVAAAFDAVVDRAARGELRAGEGVLSVSDGALAVTEALRSDDRRTFAEDLAKAETGDATALRARADAASGKRADGTYDGSIQTLVAIGSLDLPLAGATSDLAAFLGSLRATSRSARSASIPWALIVGWPWARRAPARPISAPSAAPMLVVSTRHDPLAVHEDGVALVDAFANGSRLVTFEGDGHVAILHSDCVRSIATDYFLDPSSPPRATTCAPD